MKQAMTKNMTHFAFAKLRRSMAAPSRSFRFPSVAIGLPQVKRYSFSERGWRSKAAPLHSIGEARYEHNCNKTTSSLWCT